MRWWENFQFSPQHITNEYFDLHPYRKAMTTCSPSCPPVSSSPSSPWPHRRSARPRCCRKVRDSHIRQQLDWSDKKRADNLLVMWNVEEYLPIMVSMMARKLEFTKKKSDQCLRAGYCRILYKKLHLLSWKRWHWIWWDVGITTLKLWWFLFLTICHE